MDTLYTYRTETGLAVRTFRPSAAVASAQLIDISNYQGRFNSVAAKAAVPDLVSVIYRLTQGLGGSGTNSPDPDAAWNHGDIKRAGLHPGSYHFLDPSLSGAAQAHYYVAEQARLGFTQATITVLDNETHGLSGPSVAACADAFMAELVKLRPDNPRLAYTYINFAQTGNCAGLGGYPLWLAYPNLTAPQAPPPWHNWTVWQWGTRFAGGQTVDADAFNGTAAEFSAWLSSFAPPVPVTVGGFYRHVTDGKTPLSAIAASRGYSDAQSFLEAQARHYGTLLSADPAEAAAALQKLGAAVPQAGLDYYTLGP